MPLDRRAEFVAVDEIQLCADPDRGHVFTDRLLNARGMVETMFLGAETIRPLLQRLVPQAEVETRPRLSQLTHAGPQKLTRLPPRSAVVAFSAAEVYAIAEAIRRRRGGCAVVMGRLSPRTRNAQVALYQNREVDFLVATDAIGMGLNMDVDHVAFAALQKFDGHQARLLNAQEAAQIAGRAGRGMRDGTFGTTGDCPPLPDEIVNKIEAHISRRCRPWPGATANWTSPASMRCSTAWRHRRRSPACPRAMTPTTTSPSRCWRARPRCGPWPAAAAAWRCCGKPARCRISASWRTTPMSGSAAASSSTWPRTACCRMTGLPGRSRSAAAPRATSTR
ncbi:helicase-related protein [Siccirubricoccus deserti]